MTDLLYTKLCSERNLQLAWARLKTAQNHYYKRYYRNLFLAYDLHADKLIPALSKRLIGHSFKPTGVLRFYVPKSSGLHRPISFLHLDDLIVYQAFANIFGGKLHAQLSDIQGQSTFSNILSTTPATNIFFFEKWQNGYSAYLKTIKKYYRQGNKWVVHFDLAAYYDTISHETFTNQVSRQGTTPEFSGLLRECLREWSSTKTQKVGHGIPQGPVTSNLIGELYLLPIDQCLKKHDVTFVRYVDDIKILGNTREEVLNGVLVLEKECKERGLIPQAKKYELAYAKTIKEAIGKTPSFTESEKKDLTKDEEATWELFKEAFDPATFDASRVKYILKSSGKNRLILRKVIACLHEYPHLCDEFAKFLRQYASNSAVGCRVFETALKIPSHFEYVEGIYWELLSDFSFSKQQHDKFVRHAINRLLSKARHKYALKLGIYRFLASTNNSLVTKWLKTESSSFVQMYSVGYIHESCHSSQEYLDLCNHLLGRSHYEPAIVVYKELIHSFTAPQTISKVIAPKKDTTGVLQSVFTGKFNIDPIGELLHRGYTINNSDAWRTFFGKEYDHANRLAHLANNSVHLERNTWINYIDSFNDILVRQLLLLLSEKRPQEKWGKPFLDDGTVVDLGGLLDPNKTLYLKYPHLLDGIRAVHKRRSKTPTSHAYDKKTRDRTISLDGREQKKLMKQLSSNYSSLLTELAVLRGIPVTTYNQKKSPVNKHKKPGLRRKAVVANGSLRDRGINELRK